MVLHHSLFWKERPWKSTRDETRWPSAENNNKGAEVVRLKRKSHEKSSRRSQRQRRRESICNDGLAGKSRCPVACLEKYLAKRDPRCDALWQKPKNHNASSFHSTDEVWFCNVPLGKHKLENLLTEMCKTAGLAHIYTPHCIRATSVTVLKAAGLESHRVKSVTGHASDKSRRSRSTFPYSCSTSWSNYFVCGSNVLERNSTTKPAGLPAVDLQRKSFKCSRLYTFCVSRM